MRTAIIVVAALIVVDIAIIAGTASGTPYMWPLFSALGLSMGLAGVVIVAVTRRTINARLVASGNESSSRVCLVGGIVMIVNVLFVSVTPRDVAAVGEIAYYIALVGAGVVLARWATSGPAAPIWMATAVLLVLAILHAAMFVRSSFDEFGAEGPLFLLWGLAGRLNMLPLDATAAWAGWWLAVPRGNR